MTSPQEVIEAARRGPVPVGWRVFTKRRGKGGAFFRGTSRQPDPVLVITPAAAAEYASDQGPLPLFVFAWVDYATLQMKASSSSDSTSVRIRFCVDVRLTDGRTVQWKSATFPARIDVVQRFVECCAVHAFWRHLSADGYRPPGAP